VSSRPTTRSGGPDKIEFGALCLENMTFGGNFNYFSESQLTNVSAIKMCTYIVRKIGQAKLPLSTSLITNELHIL